MCHTRELAFQISKEYERFSKYMPSVKVSLLRRCAGFYVALWSHAGLSFSSSLSVLSFVVIYVPYKSGELWPAPTGLCQSHILQPCPLLFRLP